VRILADESADFLFVRRLREGGNEVTAIAEVSSGLEDRSVARQAAQSGSILLTEDKDFGQLVTPRARERSESSCFAIRRPVAITWQTR